jgi:hypothetical protein
MPLAPARRVVLRLVAVALVALCSLGIAGCKGKVAGDGRIDPPSSVAHRK